MSDRAPNQIGLAEPLVAAVDNGGSNTQILIVQGLTRVSYAKYDTPPNYEDGVSTMVEAIHELTNGRPVDAIGISAAGKVRDGRIVSAGALQEKGYVDRAFQDDIAGELVLESGLVIIRNDCIMAALAQRVANQRTNGARTGYIETISTGNGGSGFTLEPEVAGETEIEDEPGHEHLKDGAICPCGIEGHVEAHIGGRGVELKFGVKAEDLPLDCWPEIVGDTVEAHVRLLNRLAAKGFRPATIYLFGSMATKQPFLLMPGLTSGLRKRQGELPFLPSIAYATHGDDSGLVGARDAALEALDYKMAK